MKRVPNILIILGIAAALAAGLFLLVQRGTESQVAATIEKAITESGGRFEEIAYKSSGNVLTIRGLELPRTDAPDSLISIGLARLTGANPEGIGRALNAPATGTASEQERLFAALDLEGVRIVDPRRVTTIGMVMLREAIMMPPAAEQPDGVVTLDELKTKSREELVAATFLRLKLGALTLSEARIAPTNGSPVTVARVVMENYDRANIASLEASEVATAGADPEGKPLSLQALKVLSEDLDLAALIAALGERTLPGAGEDIPVFPVWMPRLGDTVIEGITATSASGTITLDRIAMTDAQYLDNISVGGALELAGLRIALDAQTGADLTALGYTGLALDLSYRLRYDEEAAESRIEDFVLGGTDMGRLTGEAEFGNVTFYRDIVGLTVPELLRGGQFARILQSVRLNALDLAYTDASLVRRILESSATEAGMTQEAYVADLVTNLRSNEEAYASDPFLASAFDALAQFLQSPGSLSLKIAPETPPSLAEVVAVVTIAPLMATRLLNVTIEASGPEEPAANASPPTAPAGP